MPSWIEKGENLSETPRKSENLSELGSLRSPVNSNLPKIILNMCTKFGKKIPRHFFCYCVHKEISTAVAQWNLIQYIPKLSSRDIIIHISEDNQILCNLDCNILLACKLTYPSKWSCWMKYSNKGEIMLLPTRIAHAFVLGSLHIWSSCSVSLEILTDAILI